jgi:plasmanylethanolamine desaturase
MRHDVFYTGYGEQQRRVAMIVLEYALEIVGCILFVDFLSGFFHWLEDAYGRPDWPITGRWITQANILHHYHPRYFTKHSWLVSADVLLLMGGLTLVFSYSLGWLNWMTSLVVLIGVNANEFHKWAHRSKAENGRLITLLQAIGLLQTPAHHAHHHRNGKNTHYCVVTNYVNPIVDAIRFWDLLELAILHVTGVKRRLDHSVMD